MPEEIKSLFLDHSHNPYAESSCHLVSSGVFITHLQMPGEWWVKQTPVVAATPHLRRFSNNPDAYVRRNTREILLAFFLHNSQPDSQGDAVMEFDMENPLSRDAAKEKRSFSAPPCSGYPALSVPGERQSNESSGEFYLGIVNIAGESKPLEKALDSIRVFGQYDAPVLITGETGTGKELAARGLHYCGSRSGHPFVAVNCATLTTDLFASEVFGHKKGAFTDARQDKKGLLAVAERGTLFLDEIDSLSLTSQAALLRLLQESEYRPVGSEKTYLCDVRLIASANCDLQEKIAAGLFRRDLFYRLHILTVHMPALRDRKDDIPVLVRHFLRQFAEQYELGEKIAPAELIDHLTSLSWPGNVRELENTIHRLYLLSGSGRIEIQHMPATDIHAEPFVPSPITTDMEPDAENGADEFPLTRQCGIGAGDYNFSRDKRLLVERFEKEYLTRILDEANGNVTRAAMMCGKDRRALGKMIKKYNIRRGLFME